MPKTTKAAQAPPDDPAQSERFVKAATELLAPHGDALFERAMKSIVKPVELPADAGRAIIEQNKAGTTMPAKKKKKRQ